MILGFKEMFPDGNPTDFIPKAAAGIKKHSLREDVHDRWKEGVMIDFATGVRSKKYKCHFRKRCTGIQRIEIRYQNKDSSYPTVRIDGAQFVYYNRKDWIVLQELAKNDGFKDFDAFCRWFNRDFKGKIIHWTALRYQKEEHKVLMISPKAGYQGLSVPEKYNRNDLCPCGSGKKIKKCCVEYLDTKYCSVNKKK